MPYRGYPLPCLPYQTKASPREKIRTAQDQCLPEVDQDIKRDQSRNDAGSQFQTGTKKALNVLVDARSITQPHIGRLQ